MSETLDLILLDELNKIVNKKLGIERPKSFNELLSFINNSFKELEEDYIIFYKTQDNNIILINNNEDYLSSKGMLFIQNIEKIRQSTFTYNYEKLPESRQIILDEKYVCSLCFEKIKIEKPLFCYVCQKIYHKKCLENWDIKRSSQNLQFSCPNCRNESPLKSWKEKLDYIDNRKNEEEIMDKLNKYELDKNLNDNINNIYETKINELNNKLNDINEKFMKYKEMASNAFKNILNKINEINKIITKSDNLKDKLPSENNIIDEIFDSLKQLGESLKIENQLDKTKYENKNIDLQNSKSQKETVQNIKTTTNPGSTTTGGPPELINTEKKISNVEKEPRVLSNYQFYDDKIFAVARIDLPDNALDITEENIIYDFQKRSFNLTIFTPGGDIYIFIIKKLYSEIYPEKSTVKVIKTKSGKKMIKIYFAKVNIKKEWDKLIE